MTSEAQERRGKQGPEPRIVWGIVLQADQESCDLTEEQRRAIDIRSISIDAIESIAEIVENPDLEDDVVKQASVTATYSEAILKLREMGIEPGMHVGRETGDFYDPLVIAEWFAGSILDIHEHEEGRITTARQGITQIQEHTIVEASLDSEGNDIHLIDARTQTPTSRNFMGMMTFVSSGRRFLATSIDKPQEDQ